MASSKKALTYWPCRTRRKVNWSLRMSNPMMIIMKWLIEMVKSGLSDDMVVRGGRMYLER